MENFFSLVDKSVAMLKKDFVYLEKQKTWTNKDLKIRLLLIVFDIFPFSQHLRGLLHWGK